MNEKKKAFDKSFEEKIPQALFIDNAWAEQIMEVLDPDLFDMVHTRKIVEIFRDYYVKYGAFPSVSLMDSMIQDVDNEAIQKKCRDYMAKMKLDPLNGDIDYVKDKTLEFFRFQVVAKALSEEILPHIEEGKNLDEIVTIFQKAVSKGTSRDVGYQYHEDTELRFIDEVITKVPTMWPYLNGLLGGGLGGKRLCTFIGPPGGGKSTLLVGCGVGALLHEKIDDVGEVVGGRTVAHYTLELSAHELARKYDAAVTGICIDDVPKRKSDVLADLKKHLPKSAKLIIKEYPMKSASVTTIKSHLARLRLKNVIPDLIIIDYGDLLRAADNIEQRQGLEIIWQDMKRLAQELEIPIVTASQTNRSGINADVITTELVSNDISKIFTSDIVITLARNLESKILGAGKMLLAKNRQGKDGQIFCYEIDTSRAQIKMMELSEEFEVKMGERKDKIELSKTEEVKNKLREHLIKRKSDDKLEN